MATPCCLPILRRTLSRFKNTILALADFSRTNRADLARLVKEREEADKAMHAASAETVKKRADLAAANVCRLKGGFGLTL